MGEAVWWLIVAAIFLVLEFGHRQFFALFIGIGAAVAAIFAIAGLPVLVQLPVFMVAAAAGLLLLRPVLMRTMHVGQYGLVSGIKAHVGHEAVLVEPVVGTTHPGRIRLDGELWKAVSNDGTPIEAGTVVLLLELQGTTFVVQDLPTLGLTSLELPEEQ
jgi:membrane protein implicated in regulation of membrane protease activity